jgi:hypothetical protein
MGSYHGMTLQNYDMAEGPSHSVAFVVFIAEGPVMPDQNPFRKYARATPR